ncbi:unnamed protein product [Natator depressus]
MASAQWPLGAPIMDQNSIALDAVQIENKRDSPCPKELIVPSQHHHVSPYQVNPPTVEGNSKVHYAAEPLLLICRESNAGGYSNLCVLPSTTLWHLSPQQQRGEG